MAGTGFRCAGCPSSTQKGSAIRLWCRHDTTPRINSAAHGRLGNGRGGTPWDVLPFGGDRQERIHPNTQSSPVNQRAGTTSPPLARFRPTGRPVTRMCGAEKGESTRNGPEEACGTGRNQTPVRLPETPGNPRPFLPVGCRSPLRIVTRSQSVSGTAVDSEGMTHDSVIPGEFTELNVISVGKSG